MILAKRQVDEFPIPGSKACKQKPNQGYQTCTLSRSSRAPCLSFFLCACAKKKEGAVSSGHPAEQSLPQLPQLPKSKQGSACLRQDAFGSAACVTSGGKTSRLRAPHPLLGVLHIHPALQAGCRAHQCCTVVEFQTNRLRGEPTSGS